MTVEDTKEMREIRNVAATMAVENMPLSKEFISELIKVDNGEKTLDELRKETI